MLQIIVNEKSDSLDQLQKLTTRLRKKRKSLERIIDRFLSLTLDDKDFNYEKFTAGFDGKQQEKFITAIQKLGDTVYLQPKELQTAASNFSDNYYIDDPNNRLVFGEIKVNYTQLLGLVPKTDYTFACFKFIHRLDDQNQWYLSVQHHLMEHSGPISLDNNEVNIDPRAILFDLTPTGGIVTPYNPNFLEGSPFGFKDTQYQDKVKYKNLQPDQWKVWSVTIPWRELVSLHECNTNHGLPDDSYYFKFKSVSYDLTALPKRSSIPFPHCIAIYSGKTDTQGVDQDHLLEGDVCHSAIFRDGAANLDTLSPPNHNVYFWPPDLTV